MIRRRGQKHDDDHSESSSEEEDAFSALSKRNANKRLKTTGNNLDKVAEEKQKNIDNVMKDSKADAQTEKTSMESTNTITNSSSSSSSGLPQSVTSSMKRHHKPNDTRKAKMDALLEELEEEKKRFNSVKNKSSDSQRFIPEKKGSFVDPEEEHLTTNVFVGGLAPSITEEDLSGLFSQFDIVLCYCTNNASDETTETGDLYSIKIMWPRTMEERLRGRNTGFVCFMRRDDAEEAMEACNETDPFNVGRLLMMRWGKNVKKNVRRGTGGLEETSSSANSSLEQGLIEGGQTTSAPAIDSASTKVPPARRETSVDLVGGKRQDGPSNVALLVDHEMHEEAKPYDPELHSTTAIRIETPADKSRFHFISRVASFVAKDGVDFEKRLIEEEGKNPLFNFLTVRHATDQRGKEHLFYRWRVYSFLQGDTYSIWRTEPFIMFHPRGRFWIPPPLDAEAAAQEREARAGNDNDRRQLNENRRKREHRTGNQFELARSFRRKGRGQPSENSTTLSAEDLLQFETLVMNELSISREAICRAMAFCFDKCLAAVEVSNLLKEALLDDSPIVIMDMRIARLYLLSDILFNSQQPGVKNAFMYRSTIESMAPEIFRSLGKHRDKNIGRMTINKLRRAVSAVLGAWTEWGVYNPIFLDELEAHFEGREVKSELSQDDSVGGADQAGTQKEEADAPESMDEIVFRRPRGDWTTSELGADHEQTVFDASSDDSDHDSGIVTRNSQELSNAKVGLTREKSVGVKENAANGDVINGGLDAENDDGIDGEPFEEMIDKLGGEAPETMDGSSIGAEDLDGEDIDEEKLDGEDLDGENLDGEDLDGDEIDDDDAIDGEVISDHEEHG